MALPSITLRNTKGSALTHTEMDTNLTNLQSANITVTANGTTSNIQLGSGFILSAGANIGLTNTAGNITITNTMPAGGGSGITDLVSDTSPQLGGNLDPNDHTYTAANIYSGHRFTLSGIDGGLELSALSGGMKFTAPETFSTTNVKFYANAINGAASSISGDAPMVEIVNIHTAASAEASMQLHGGAPNSAYGTFGFFKGVNSHYTHPYSINMQPGDGGMYVTFGDFHITPLKTLNFALPNPFVSGKVKFTGLLETNPAFEFDLDTGDLTFDKGNILLAADKGIYADSGLVIGSDDVILGQGDSGVTAEVAITTAGGQGLFFDTNQGVDTGSFSMTAGVNGNINITPNGTGRTVITNATLDNPAITNITSVNKVTITAPATSATLTIANGKTLTASNTITLAGTDSTVMTFPPASSDIGYLNMPQVNLTAFTGTRGFELSDSGKHIYTFDGGETLSIPVNSNIAFPLGTVITVVNHSTVNVTISPGAVSLYLAGNTSAGSRTITSHGVATLIKVATDTWFINGTGVG